MRTTATVDEVTEVFGQVEFISVEGVADEHGFVTGVMSESAYEKCAEQLPNILQMIRVR